MNKAEVKTHLDNMIGEDSQQLSDMGFMIAICKVWQTVRKVVVFIKPFLKLKKGWLVAAEAFIMLMDSRCGVDSNR